MYKTDYKYEFRHKTSNYTISAARENGIIFTNKGAITPVTFTLPRGAVPAETTFWFIAYEDGLTIAAPFGPGLYGVLNGVELNGAASVVLATGDRSMVEVAYFNDNEWQVISSTAVPTGGGGGDVVSDEGSSVDGELVLFSGVTGKHIKNISDDGVVTLINGVATVIDGIDNQIVKRVGGVWGVHDLTEGALYVKDFLDNGQTLQDAADAFAISSVPKLVFPASQTFTFGPGGDLNDVPLMFNGTDKEINGNGCTIITDLSTDQYGAIWLQALNNSYVHGFEVHTPSDAATAAAQGGLRWMSTSNKNRVERFNTHPYIKRAIWYQGSATNTLRNCVFDRSVDFHLNLEGEYLVVVENVISNSFGNGVRLSGGNNELVNNHIEFNDGIGIDNDNASINSDHCTILGNLINHNKKAGLVSRNTLYGLIVIGNQIDANGSIGASINLGGGVEANSFPVFLDTVKGIIFSGNFILRNKAGIGLNGVRGCQFTNNQFIPNPTAGTNPTEYHIKELGGTNNNYRVDDNTFWGNLSSGTVDLARLNAECPNRVTTNEYNTFIDAEYV